MRRELAEKCYGHRSAMCLVFDHLVTGLMATLPTIWLTRWCVSSGDQVDVLIGLSAVASLSSLVSHFNTQVLAINASAELQGLRL